MSTFDCGCYMPTNFSPPYHTCGKPNKYREHSWVSERKPWTCEKCDGTTFTAETDRYETYLKCTACGDTE